LELNPFSLTSFFEKICPLHSTLRPGRVQVLEKLKKKRNPDPEKNESKQEVGLLLLTK
jgi:hypothetical protein